MQAQPGAVWLGRMSNPPGRARFGFGQAPFGPGQEELPRFPFGPHAQLAQPCRHSLELCGSAAHQKSYIYTDPFSLSTSCQECSRKSSKGLFLTRHSCALCWAWYSPGPCSISNIACAGHILSFKTPMAQSQFPMGFMHKDIRLQQATVQPRAALSESHSCMVYGTYAASLCNDPFQVSLQGAIRNLDLG